MFINLNLNCHTWLTATAFQDNAGVEVYFLERVRQRVLDLERPKHRNLQYTGGLCVHTECWRPRCCNFHPLPHMAPEMLGATPWHSRQEWITVFWEMLPSHENTPKDTNIGGSPINGPFKSLFSEVQSSQVPHTCSAFSSCLIMNSQPR